MIKLHDKNFELFISEEEIIEETKRIATKLNKEYNEQKILFLSILNGSFMFTAELMKHITFPCEIQFIKIHSYEGTTSGSLKLHSDLGALNLKNKSVIILEDIVDSGNTIEYINQCLKAQEIQDMKVISLLYKPDSYRKDIIINDYGFSISNHFVVGYGLDYDQLGRNLPDIYKLKK